MRAVCADGNDPGEAEKSDAGERGGVGLSPEQGQSTLWDPVR